MRSFGAQSRALAHRRAPSAASAVSAVEQFLRVFLRSRSGTGLEIRLASFVGRGALTPEFTRSGVLSAPGDDRLAIVKMPTGRVDVTVRLDRVSRCTGGTCTDLTLCASPIQFQFDAANVSQNRCHVVLHLDVA